MAKYYGARSRWIRRRRTRPGPGRKLDIESCCMGRPWFSCRPVDEGVFERAPLHLRGRFAIPKRAEEVWADLTSDTPLDWCRILQEVTWTSPRPFGVGTTRTVRALHGASVLKERYFRWEEGRRHSFHVVEASAPLFRWLAEDYLVEPGPDDSCTFTWTIAARPRGLARLATPVNRRLLGTLFTDTRTHYGLS